MAANPDDIRFQDGRIELTLQLSIESRSRREEASATIEMESSVLISGMLKMIELLFHSFLLLFSSLLAFSPQTA